MRQEAVAVARVAATRQPTAQTSRKRNTLLIPSDRAALCIVEAHGARTCHILAARIVMHLRARTDAVRGPYRTGTAALVGECHARLIPRGAAAGWPLKADGIATRRIHAAWCRMDDEGRSRPRASTDCDAHKRRQIRAVLIPHNPTAVWLDGANGCCTLHIGATALGVRLKAIASPTTGARRQLAAEAQCRIGERLLYADGIPQLHAAEGVVGADLIAARAVVASLQEARHKATATIGGAALRFLLLTEHLCRLHAVDVPLLLAAVGIGAAHKLAANSVVAVG